MATIFITNKECPFRCLMCDRWRNTAQERTPAGTVAGQIAWALEKMSPARHLKLHNSGNFFDETAIPAHDRRVMAGLVEPSDTVIVECHPRMVDRRCGEFAESIRPRFEVAMGLETVDPDVLPRLNKRMTLEHGIHLGTGRVFLDLWAIDKFCQCPKCGPQRADRLKEMNLAQTVPPSVTCNCGT